MIQPIAPHPASLTSVAARRPGLCAFVAAAALLLAPLLAFATPGDLDASFGTVASPGAYSFTNAQGFNGRASAVQSTGKIVSVLQCGPQATADFCVTRLSADGSQLDTTFATSGVFTIGDPLQQEFAYALVVDNSDRILVAGRCGGASPCLFRLTANGALDMSFGVAGIASLPGTITGTAIRLMGDGRIVVAARCFSAHDVFCLHRRLTDGGVDSSFNGGSGLVIDMSASTNQSTSLALYPDGRILIAGYCDNGNTSNSFCLARVGVNGALDTSFNGNGKKLLSVSGGTGDSSQSVALTASGRIILGGRCGTYANPATWRFCVAALTSGGALDTSFPGGGVLNFPSTFTYVLPVGMHVTPDEKILLTGRCAVSPAAMCLLRILPGGTLDPSFGAGGSTGWVVDEGMVGSDAATSFLAPGNRLLMTGTCNPSASATVSRACIARFVLDPPSGERCSLDLDDDGFVKPATDGLMWLRIMLGIRGNAVLAAPMTGGATRSTWPLIRDYLSNNCGIH